MARIEFVPDMHRDGECGLWGAIHLADGTLCAAMRLPVDATDRPTVSRVLATAQKLMRAAVPGIAPIADVAVGGDQLWVFVGIAPGPSIADLLDDAIVTPTDAALISLDSGRALAGLHERGLRHGAFSLRTVVASRRGTIQVTEAGLAPALDNSDDNRAPTYQEAVRADAECWADAVGELAVRLRRLGFENQAMALDRSAAAAREHGLPTALEDLDEAAQVFAGYASRVGLQDVMRRYDMEDEPDPDALERAIDALFAATGGPQDRPPTSPDGPSPEPPSPGKTSPGKASPGPGVDGSLPSGGGRPPAGSVERVDVAQRDADAVPVAVGAATALAVADGDALENAAEAVETAGAAKSATTEKAATEKAATAETAPEADEISGGRAARPATVDAAEDADRGAVGDARDADGPAAGVATAPRTRRRPSVIPTRRATTGTPTTTNSAPGGLWVPKVAPESAQPTGSPTVRPAQTGDESDRPERVMRLGRGVPASNTRRPAPARLGRPAWWPRLAINIGLAVAIVLGVGGYVWWRSDRPLHVSSVSITVQRHFATACQLDADVVGTVLTSGGSGTFTYQWQRSDGTTTPIYTAKVGDASKPTEVHLQWTFNGVGEETAQVALIVLRPQRRQASTSFEYICK
jgi:hypothetical protein